MARTDKNRRDDLSLLSDLALARRAVDGQRDAFALIMQRHNQALFRTARAILRDDAEAEDTLQESYMRAFAALATFRGEAQMATWLTRIVVNEARGRLRQRRRRMVDLDRVETEQAGCASLILSFPGGEPMVTPEAAAARAEIRLLLEQSVDRLADPFRLVFVLREVQGQSVEETALLLDLKPQTVRTRLHRARAELRASLDQTLSSSIRGTFPFLGRRCENIIVQVMGRLGRRQPPPGQDN